MTFRPEVALPNFKAPQRAALLLREGVDGWGQGWALLDGPWLHWFADDFPRWVSIPASDVARITWQESA